MKLLYIWIEEFRNIHQQGVVVDSEYTVTISPSVTEKFLYINHENQRVSYVGEPSGLDRKVYQRRLSWYKNVNYKSSFNNVPIKIITALIGENASGKTSIIECLHMKADQFHYSNEEGRYFLLVFLDEERQSMVVRTRDIWLIGQNTRKHDYRQNSGYEEYVLHLCEGQENISCKNDDITHIVSFYQDRRENTEWVYSMMGLPTIPLNLERRHARNTFTGVFDFFCAFPSLGGLDNKLVFYLKDQHSREKVDYFKKHSISLEEYKSYYIYKLSSFLFGKVRDFLYHEKPQFVMSGKRIIRPEEDILRKEDLECAEVLAFCSFGFPRRDSTSLFSTSGVYLPKEQIEEAIDFFRKSTYVYNVKPVYDRYIDALEKLFNCLYNIEPECFTALYKLEIPFESQYNEIVTAFWNCLELDHLDRNWTESIVVDFEWLSAGEYQLAIMFSGLYQRLTEQYDGFEKRDLIMLFDEPEMHMHPQAGRIFIKNLIKALNTLKDGGLVRGCQIIMSTHSPFIVQELCDYQHSIALVKKESGQISIGDFNNIEQLKLPKRTDCSFNLVMYKVFGVPTVELHNELYGVLQEQNELYTITAMEKWLVEHGVHKAKKWIMEKKGIQQPQESITLQSFIRNCIHHPENRHNGSYSPSELKLSIDKMITLLNQ